MNIINFSGGRTSAYMTKRLIDEGLTDYKIVFQNTGKEAEETLIFIDRCSKEWGLTIDWIEYDIIEGDKKKGTFKKVSFETASRKGEPFEKAINYNKGFLPSNFQRYCTKFLKLKTLKYYLKSIGVKYYTNYLGIRYDEPDRVAKLKASDRFVKEELELPLYKWKITKADVLDWWIEMEDKYDKQFRKDITYRQIRDKAISQLDLWKGDEGMNCFCNID